MSEVMLDVLGHKERYLVVFNLLKKVVDSSYSLSSILAVHCSDVGIVNKNCLLLRIRDRELFFVNPQLIFCGKTMTVLSDNIDHTFEGKEMEQVLSYFYHNKYLDKLQKIYV